jgi:tetratricopeptide (TPR) repeat protein
MRVQPGGRTRRWLCGLLLLALLGAGGAAVVLLRRDQPPPAPDLTGADPALVALVEGSQAKVRKAPRDARAWGHLGMVLQANSYFDESVVCLREAERLDPTEPRWPYFLATALTLSDPEAALTKLRRTVELLGEKAVPPRLRLAELLLAQGYAEEAEGQFRRVLQSAPHLPLAHLGMARVTAQRNDTTASLQHLERCLSDPLTARAARGLRAELFQRGGDPRAAERERRLASRLPETDPPTDVLLEEMFALEVGQTAAITRGTRLLRQGRTDEAIALLRKTTTDYPDSGPVWVALGRAYLECRRPDAAERVLRVAVEKERGEEPLRCLGQALLELGRVEEAADQFRSALQARPNSVEAHTSLGQCLKQLGRREEAIRAYRQALRYRPNSVEAHAQLGELLAAAGRKEEAREHLEAAESLKGDREPDAGGADDVEAR